MDLLFITYTHKRIYLLTLALSSRAIRSSLSLSLSLCISPSGKSLSFLHRDEAASLTTVAVLFYTHANERVERRSVMRRLGDVTSRALSLSLFRLFQFTALLCVRRGDFRPPIICYTTVRAALSFSLTIRERGEEEDTCSTAQDALSLSLSHAYIYARAARAAAACSRESGGERTISYE